MKKNMTTVLFFSLSQRQTARATVTANLTSLNELPNTRVFIAAENGSVEVLELVPLFLLKMGIFNAKNWTEISVNALSCFVELFLKREGQIHNNFDK